MKKITILSAAVCLALGALSAKADTLTFNSNPSGTTIGPYDLTYSSGSGSAALSAFCLNDLFEIQGGESWGVNVSSGQAYQGSATGTVGFQYEEESYIYNQLNGSNNTDVQDALWTVFDPTTSNKDANSPGLVSAAYAFALANVGMSGPNSLLSDTTLYIYNGSAITNQYNNSQPQNFIGDAPVPEPSSLALLGSGLLGLAEAARRKLRRP